MLAFSGRLARLGLLILASSSQVIIGYHVQKLLIEELAI